MRCQWGFLQTGRKLFLWGAPEVSPDYGYVRWILFHLDCWRELTAPRFHSGRPTIAPLDSLRGRSSSELTSIPDRCRYSRTPRPVEAVRGIVMERFFLQRIPAIQSSASLPQVVNRKS